MAHDIAMVNGQASMAYFGNTPWHGLGTPLNNPATAEEAITAAQLNYQVELQDVYTGGLLEIPSRKAVVRTDTKRVLGVVGNSYRPIQNAESFSFLNELVSSDDLRYHTAGALGQGERVWMLAKIPGYIQAGTSEDITEKFLLLTNSHDGTSSLRIYFTAIRVVCANTLAVAERRSKGQGVTIRHQGDLKSKLSEAQSILRLANRFYAGVQTGVNDLTKYMPNKIELTDYFQTLFPDPIEGSTTRAEKTRRELFRLFEEGKGQQLPGVKNSFWAAFNAVTEFTDHYRPTRAKTELERRSRRLESQWFGASSKLKSEAWSLALNMATAT